MILCSPSPGTVQSEKKTLRCLHPVLIYYMILLLRYSPNSVKNFVPGDIEFC